LQAILYGTRTKLAPKETVERRGDDSVNGHIQQTEQDLNSTFTMRPNVKIRFATSDPARRDGTTDGQTRAEDARYFPWPDAIAPSNPHTLLNYLSSVLDAGRMSKTLSSALHELRQVRCCGKSLPAYRPGDDYNRHSQQYSAMQTGSC
jgi:hypothetical protein